MSELCVANEIYLWGFEKQSLKFYAYWHLGVTIMLLQGAFC